MPKRDIHGLQRGTRPFYRCEKLESRILLAADAAASQLLTQYGLNPLAFEPNLGQTSSEVQYLSRGPGYSLFLTAAGAEFNLRQLAPTTNGSPASATLQMQLVGAKSTANATGLDKLSSASNYFEGGSANDSLSNIPNYGQVEYQNVYPGINVVYYGNGKQLEYDFQIAAGADPNDIALAFTGAKSITIDSSGELVLHTATGDVVQHAPVIYQEISGAKQVIPGRYVIENSGQVGFQVDHYDSSQPLVIDPVLVYSTYLGGSSDDWGNAIAVDGKGDVYVAGVTTSADFPTQPDPAAGSVLQLTYPSGSKNSSGNTGVGLAGAIFSGAVAFVCKYNPAGDLVFCTYLGGNGNATHMNFSDEAQGVAVDSAGDVYVTGDTAQDSPWLPANAQNLAPFPVTANALQPTNGNVEYNAFLSELAPDGSHLLFSTFLNSVGTTNFSRGVALDALGNVYVAGNTDGDPYVVKIDPTYHEVYSEPLGPDLPQANTGESTGGLAVDATGHAYVVGTTDNSGFGTKEAGTLGGNDVFVLKLNPTGGEQYQSEFGGSGNDVGNAIAVDSVGNVYVTGSTDSTDFPVENPFQFQKGAAAGSNAFVFKLNRAGDTLLYSTYLGGKGGASEPLAPRNYEQDAIPEDSGNGIAVNSAGDAYVVGTTNSINFPVQNAVQGHFGYGGSTGGYRDVFVTELKSSGSGLVYSTYYGGDQSDNGQAVQTVGLTGAAIVAYSFGQAIAVDANGNAYFTGFTTSSDVTTRNAQQSALGGGTGPGVQLGTVPPDSYQYPLDAFVAEIGNSLIVTPKPVTATINVPYVGIVATFTAPDQTLPAVAYTVAINWGDGTFGTGTVLQPGGTGTPYQVMGSHTYAAEGDFPVVVTVMDATDALVATTAVDASSVTGGQTESAIAVNPTNTQNLFAVSTFGANNIGLFAAYSLDGGATWVALSNGSFATGTGSAGDGLPAMSGGNATTAFDKFGNLYLTYIATENSVKEIPVLWSTDGGMTFSPTPLAEFPGTSSDQPKLAVGPGFTPGSASVLISFTHNNPNGSAYQVYVAGATVLAPGAGGTSPPPKFPSNPVAVPGGAGNNLETDVAVGPTGQVAVSWAAFGSAAQIDLSLDRQGLNNLSAGAFQPVPTVAAVDTNLLGTFIAVPAADYRGISGDQPWIQYDDSDGPNRGRIYLLYSSSNKPLQGSTSPQIGGPGVQNPDAVLSVNLEYSDNDGTSFSTANLPSSTGDELIPNIAVDPVSGDVAVSWYGTPAPSSPVTAYYVTVSGDGGGTFSPPAQVSAGNTNVSTETTGQYGDYSGIAFFNGEIYPAWIDNSAQLQGNPDPPVTVPDTAVARLYAANVGAPRPVVTAASVMATQGKPFSTTVATFTDPGQETPDEFHVTIDWGDGTQTPNVTPAQPGGAGTAFQVDAGHTYFSAGAYPITVTVTDTVYGVSATAIENVSAARVNSQLDSSIAVDPHDAADEFIASVSQTPDGITNLLGKYSNNGGTAWSMSMITATAPSVTAEPMVSFDSFGNVFLAYEASDLQTIVLLESSDGGMNFAPVGQFNEVGAAGTETVRMFGLATGPGGQLSPGSIWVGYRDVVDDELIAAGATDGASGLGSFAPYTYAVPLSADSQGNSLAVGPNGSVAVSFTSPLGVPASTIYVATGSGLLGNFGNPVAAATTNVGTSLSIPADPAGKISAVADLAWDRSTGPHAGRLYLVYGDSAAAGSSQTHVFERFSDNSGKTWSAPVQVDNGSGDSAFLPAAAVDQSSGDPSNGDLAITWYDTRNDPAGIKAQVFAAISSNGGAGFSGNIPISPGASDATNANLDPFGLSAGYGQYMGLNFISGLLYPAWADNSAELQLNTTLPIFNIASGGVGVAQVAPLPLGENALPATAQEGMTVTANLATFTDPDPKGQIGNYSAGIDWGDNTAPSQASITSNGGGAYTIAGTHLYQVSGIFSVTVTLKNANGLATVVNAKATVADAPLTAQAVSNIAAVRGQPFQGVVGAFTDADPVATEAGFAGTALEYSGTIDWGDGEASAASFVVNASGVISVLGAHTFTDAGTSQITVTVTDGGLGATANQVPRSMVTLQESIAVAYPAPVAQPSPPEITALPGFLSPSLALAGFTVPGGPSTVPGAYSASIDWNDGSGTPGGLLLSGNNFSVSGSHLYVTPGTYSVQTTLTGPGGTTTGAVTIVVLPDVTKQADPVASGPIYDPLTQLFSANVTITNTGSTTLTGPFPLVFVGLPAGVTVANAHDMTGSGEPILHDSQSTLAPGQSSEVSVQFQDSAFIPITYSVKVFDPEPAASPARATASYAQIPLSFAANDGQADSGIQYMAQGAGYGVFLDSGAAMISLSASSGASSQTNASQTNSSSSSVVEMTLVGANPQPAALGLDQLPGYTNYINGGATTQSITDVPNYARIQYSQVYPGIDLVYYGNQGRLEDDFVFAAGADPGIIKLQIAGAQSLTIDTGGNLIINTAAGEIVQEAPVISQRIAGASVSVPGRFVLLDSTHVGFQVGSYDRSKPLLIDPVLDYSTYLSGSATDNWGVSIAADSSGDAYVTGQTTSFDFPTSPGAFQTVIHHAALFITKLNSTGTAIVYSTFLSAPNDFFNGAAAVSIAVDGGGDAYITGFVDFDGFPTLHAVQPLRNAGSYDAFVTELNPTGTALVYSTYLGGSNNDFGNSIAVDSSGNAYIAGGTSSTNFPTLNALQSQSNNPTFEQGFVAKINPVGGLVYSTYLGGGDGPNWNVFLPHAISAAFGIAVDSQGDAYVTGETSSVTFPIVNPLPPTPFSANAPDGQNFNTFGFLSELNPSGNALIYSTYLGRPNFALDLSGAALSVAVDAQGSAYVTGYGNVTVADGGFFYQKGNNAVNTGWVAKVTQDSGVPSLAYGAIFPANYDYFPQSTNGSNSGQRIAIDSSGDAWVTGDTLTTGGFPIMDPLTQNFSSAFSEPFVMELNPSGTALRSSSVLGGSSLGWGSGIAVDASDNVYVTGGTESFNFPTTAGVIQPVTNFAFYEGFVLKINSPPPAGILQVAAVPIHAFEGIAFTGIVANFTDSVNDALDDYSAMIDWGDGNTSSGSIAVNPAGGFSVTGTHTFAEEGFYPVAVTVTDVDGSSATATATDVQSSAGGDVTYLVDVNTANLAGTSGTLAVQFNPGVTGQAATVSISNVNITDGDLTSAHTELGSATGSLSSTAQISNTTLLNEILAGIDFGTDISFALTISGPAVEQPAGGAFGSTFAVQILAADGITPLETIDPSGAVLTADVNPDGSTHETNFPSSAAGGAPVAGTVNVADALFSADGVALDATAQTPFAGAVAYFFDVNRNATFADYQPPLIAWGDGQASTGSFIAGPGAFFSVTGTHTYAHAGSFTATVTVTDKGGSIATAVSTFTVVAHVLTSDDSYSTTEDAGQISQGPALHIAAPGVLSNDTDVDGLALTVSLVRYPNRGILQLDANGDGGFRYVAGFGFVGTDSFVYRATDSAGFSSDATVFITTSPVAPTPADDAYYLYENSDVTALQSTLLSNDSAPFGESLTASLVSGPSHGVLDFVGGAFTYTPDAGFVGTDSFVYQATATNGLSGTATAQLNVFALPVGLNNDSYSTDENKLLTIGPAQGVLSNDLAPAGESLTATLMSDPDHGLVTFDVNGDGGFTYTPTSGYAGPDSFAYRATDTNFAWDEATVNLTVNAVAPTTVKDAYAMNENTTLAIPTAQGILRNDTAPDGESLAASLVSGPTHGALTFDANGDGGFQYVPSPGYEGSDSFVYEATDTNGLSANATVNLTVTAVAPTLLDDLYNTIRNTTLSINSPGVLSNDSAPAGESLTSTLVSGPSHGMLTFGSAGGFVYVPDPNYAGADSFVYRATDTNGLSANATVNLTVTAITFAPSVVGVTYSTSENATLAIAAAQGVLVVDTASTGNSLSASLVSGPAHGALILDANGDGGFNYVPAAGYVGGDSFVYKATATNGLSANAVVNLIVTTVAAVPNAVNDSYSTSENTTLTIAAAGVLSNDSDPAGESLSASLVTGPAHGVLTLDANGDGGFKYLPATGYAGPDSFVYKATDADGQSANATVHLTVMAVTPIAVNDTYGINEDTTLTIAAAGALSNDSAPAGESLAASLVSGPVHGMLTLDADGDGGFKYVPNTGYAGPDSFVYKATDTNGLSANATVNLTVMAVAPIAVNDTYSTNEDTTLTIAAKGVLSNDSAPAGESLSASLMTGPAHGLLTLDANGDGGFKYVPNTGYVGSDWFVYKATTTSGLSANATVDLTVHLAARPPVVSASGASTVNEGSQYTLKLSAVEPPASGNSVLHWTVNWGDGPAEVFAGNPSSVTHTYHAVNSYKINAAVTDNVGSYAAGPVAVSVTVANVPLVAAGKTITGLEGRIITPTVASFTTSNSAIASNFIATIKWGDGTTSAGTIVKDSAGHFHVIGTHAYAEENPRGYALSITIKSFGASNVTVSGIARIADAPLVKAAGINFSVKKNATFTNHVLANFTDEDALNRDSDDYVGTSFVNWGDGKITKLTASNFKRTGSNAAIGSFWQILGTHKYTSAGVKRVTMLIKDNAASTVTLTLTITVTLQ